MAIELLKLPNVRLHKDAGNVTEDKLHVTAKGLAWEVATKNPLWTVEVTGLRTYRALDGAEELGTFGAEWHGSSQKLFVRNMRICNESMRKTAYHTEKIDKALLKVKKYFAPMTLAEYIKSAKNVAEEVLTSQRQNVRGRLGRHYNPIYSSQARYAQENYTQYLLWLKAKNDTAVLEHIREHDQATADMKTIEDTLGAYTNKKTALVVLSGGKYIVKIHDNVQLYDDVTFPNELRGKLGMLKLVENEQMVTGIGCRVNDEIFVLVLENADEKTEEAEAE